MIGGGGGGSNFELARILFLLVLEFFCRILLIVCFPFFLLSLIDVQLGRRVFLCGDQMSTLVIREFTRMYDGGVRTTAKQTF